MPVGPNLAETPRCAKIRKLSEAFIYVLLLFFVYPIWLKNDEIIFKKYLQDFNKSYENDTVYQQRFKAFKQSLENIEILNNNRSNDSATYGLTKYSDLFPEEFFNSRLILKLPDYISNNYTNKKSANNHTAKKRSLQKVKYHIPKKLDYREKGVLSEVQTQGSCGACWAFSVIGIIETMNALKRDKFTKLSVQQMIDCSEFNYGCDGGDICSLLNWLTSFNIKILPEKIYPLTWETENCKLLDDDEDGVQVEDFGCDSFENEEDIMLYLLANLGPLAVSINAQSWQHYIGGVIQYHCDGNMLELNHAVQIVGYDLTSPVPYYIVKNSWGTDFGDEGYLYIAIGNNICGLAHEVASVIVL
ncbi:cathepsin O-like [Diabrotica undecimpunctata]|uniref:cathepsin O-like n=1 Tax=Diabrotica undecimpunctata TaxID=50387 RepID=UPI003B636583